jgi:hypothetical protein
MKKKIIKLYHKIFKRKLIIYRYTGLGEKVGTVINKALIKDVSIGTVDVLENGRCYFHSHIEITTVDDHVYDVNTHENYVKYIPHFKMGLVKYSKYIIKLIKSPFCDYTLEDRPDTIFGSNS